MTPSHRLKLDRAVNHLGDLDALVATLRQPRTYPVVETMERRGEKPKWIYRLDLRSMEPSESFAIILGDFLFNLRCALDHLVVAISPNKHKREAGFPIFTKDPLATREGSHDYVDRVRARRWLSATEGLPTDCLAALRSLQPHGAPGTRSGPATEHPLAILSALQNADRHRYLVGVISGLDNVHATLAGETLGVVPVLKHGAVLAVEPQRVELTIEGTAVVGIGDGNVVRSFDVVANKLLRFVAGDVLPRLEPFLGR